MFDAMFTLIGHSGAYVNQRGLHPPRGIHGRGAGAFRCQDGKYVQFDTSSARHLVWFAQAGGHHRLGSGAARRRAPARRGGQPAAACPAARAVSHAHGRGLGGAGKSRRRRDRLGPHDRASGSPPSTRGRSARSSSSKILSSARRGWPGYRCTSRPRQACREARGTCPMRTTLTSCASWTSFAARHQNWRRTTSGSPAAGAESARPVRRPGRADLWPAAARVWRRRRQDQRAQGRRGRLSQSRQAVAPAGPGVVRVAAGVLEAGGLRRRGGGELLTWHRRSAGDWLPRSQSAQAGHRLLLGEQLRPVRPVEERARLGAPGTGRRRHHGAPDAAGDSRAVQPDRHRHRHAGDVRDRRSVCTTACAPATASTSRRRCARRRPTTRRPTCSSTPARASTSRAAT